MGLGGWGLHTQAHKAPLFVRWSQEWEDMASRINHILAQNSKESMNLKFREHLFILLDGMLFDS